MDIHIVIEKGESGYWVYSPELPGCTSWGQDLSEARKNMKDAVNGHLDVAREYNDDVINNPVVETLHI